MAITKPKVKQKRKTGITKKTAAKKTKPKQTIKTKTVTAKAKKKTVSALIKKPEVISVTEPAVSTVKIDFCGVSLTPLRYSFLWYYLTPGQSCFHNAYQSAVKAGFAESTARTDVYGILREPDIQKIIAANDKLVQLSLREAAKRAIEIKQSRAFYDPLDYFEETDIEMESKNGDVYTKKGIGLKPLEKMTPEQRLCIDGLDVKGQASTPVYLMPDREKNLNDIIKLDVDLSKSIGNNDLEETREIIMERITIKETKRSQLPTDLEYEIVEEPYV
jgi:hypothetical protein